MKHLITLTLCILLFTDYLYAEGKKPIQVRFTITEPQYRDFYESETLKIEKACSAQMVDFLNKTFGFFLFNLENNQQVLHIELTDNEQNLSSHSSLREVGFKVYIKQPENLGSNEPVYWVFRPVERYIESLPDLMDEFVDEVIQSFQIGVLNNKEALVKNIFSKVMVASDFYFIQDKKWFILPIAEKENNIAKFSLFLIITSVPDDIFGSIDSYDTTQVTASIINREIARQKYHLPETYPEGSLAVKKLAIGPGELPADLPNTDNIVKKIFIIKHLPLVNSDLELVSPKSLIHAPNQ